MFNVGRNLKQKAVVSSITDADYTAITHPAFHSRTKHIHISGFFIQSLFREFSMNNNGNIPIVQPTPIPITDPIK